MLEYLEATRVGKSSAGNPIQRIQKGINRGECDVT